MPDLQYCMVEGRSSDDLADAVNEYIADGWEPIGGVRRKFAAYRGSMEVTTCWVFSKR